MSANTIAPRGPQPGDRCHFLRDPQGVLLVQHYGCDNYADGTVTDPRTGKVIPSRTDA